MQAQNAFLSKDSDDDDEIDLLGLFGTLLDHKWLIGSVTAAFCAAGIGYATLATPIYRADALVQVEQKAAGIPGLSDIGEMFGAERCLYGSNFPIEKIWTTYPEIIGAFRAAAAGYSPQEQRAILGAPSANRPYHVCHEAIASPSRARPQRATRRTRRLSPTARVPRSRRMPVRRRRGSW